MVDVDWEVDQREGVTFVTAIVTNTRSTPQCVRLENQLDGPTWPPRREDLTASEWNGCIWEAVVEPGRRRGIGFASPSPPEPAEPPIEIVDVTRHSEDTDPSKDDVLASLDEWSPTADVLVTR